MYTIIGILIICWLIRLEVKLTGKQDALNQDPYEIL